MESGFASFVRKLRRTKPLGSNVLDTSLKRCLSTFDITLLGVGHMMGSGIYVLTATVAKSVAGPAIVVAFLISGVASLLAAFSYAEFGVRFPKAGSAYSYTYLAVGEFWAFIVGWNVVLENVIGLAAVARACSAYIDSLLGNIMKSWSEEHVGRINVPFFSEEPDLFAFVIILAFLIIMSVGVRASTHINNIFSMVNIGVALLVIAVGSYFANLDNWTNPDTGGFMPFGWHGVLAASASCFYAYVGFDSIASSGEEARDPQKSLPIATFVSMSIVTVVYVAISAVLTLMVNYKDITSESGLPDALAANGATWAKWGRCREIIIIAPAVVIIIATTAGALSSPQTPQHEYVPTASSPQVQSPQAPHCRPPTAKSHRLLLYASTTRPTQCGASARTRYCKRLSAALLTLLAHTEKSRASDRDSNT
ncbi:hypothetical protein HPB47_020146 [Ixodes persulcatus]|uniref:Uncharacterized protein n=1 Tax=Ixodes persulcatus TaxID=34615 RepID=A0AC60QG47_IXOPE|nr:hypothetical protein HPB47_020146 [Ixodes persulcatus]